MSDLATYEDKYGEERVIHKTRHGLRVKRDSQTPILQMNPVIAAMVGRRIRKFRLERCLTLTELATRCGMVGGHPKERIWAYENATRGEGMRLGTLYAFAMALDVGVKDLLPSVSEVRDAADVHGVDTPQLTVAPTA